jgi:DNA-binding transcriptional LysR family regulator
MHPLNLNHLAIFDAVAAEGSVTRGAAKLMITQPAVSKQLAVLERQLGVELLERLPRGVRLTEEGKLLARYARQIFALRDEAQAALVDIHNLSRGTLRIGASTTIGTYLIPDSMVRFRRSYPGIRTYVDIARSADIERRLLDSDLDLGLIEHFSGEPRLNASAFYKDDLIAIAPARHPLARRRLILIQELCREPFIVRETGSETKSFVERFLAQKQITVAPILSVPSTEAIKKAVAAGLGVAIVSRLSVDLELVAKRLAVLPVKGLSIERVFHRLSVPGRKPGSATSAFLDVLQKSLQLSRP